MDGGFSEVVERLMKGYRSMLNDKLRKADAGYAKANDIYSDASTALGDMQKAMGPSVDITSDAAAAHIGQRMRAYLGNNANRIKVESAVGEIQSMANKYGGNFEAHDIAAQMKFVNEMEKLWGPFTDTSFKSEIGQSATRAIQNPGAVALAKEGVQMTARQMNKAKVSQAAQIKALENLLSQ
jgi:hypothetical protein